MSLFTKLFGARPKGQSPNDSRAESHAIRAERSSRLCGDDLTPDLWTCATDAFERRGGRRKTELQPQPRATTSVVSKASSPETVRFVREDRNQRLGIASVYRVHEARDAATAKAFLQRTSVTRPNYYVVVETPDGNYCRDIQGIYRE
jgi:hypothetical protein